MNSTTMKMTVVVGGPPEEGQPRPTPESGSTDPHAFLKMRARQRVARTRMRRLKRGVLALAAVTLIGGGWVRSRGQRHAVPVVAVHPAPVVAPALPVVENPSPAAAPIAAEAAAITPAGASCEQDFTQRQWAAAIESC